MMKLYTSLPSSKTPFTTTIFAMSFEHRSREWHGSQGTKALSQSSFFSSVETRSATDLAALLTGTLKMFASPKHVLTFLQMRMRGYKNGHEQSLLGYVGLGER